MCYNFIVMKKSLKIAAAALAVGAVITLAGCSGCSSCNKNNKLLAVTSSNWYTGTSYKGIQPSFIPSESHPEYTKEIIEYTVTLDKSSAGNAIYSVDYENGKYTTEFYAFEYDWSTNRFYAGTEKEPLYAFVTKLDIWVTFTHKTTGKTGEKFHDFVNTVAYFRAAGKNLQPVYSKQEIVSHSPAGLQPASIEYACEFVNETYENFYNYDCSAVTTVNGENTNVYEKLNDIKYSVFDNSSLYIAARSLKLSQSLTQTFYLYNAAAGGPSEYVITGADTALDSTEEKKEIKDISAEMQRCGLFVPSEERTTIPTVALNINYAGGNLHGTTQTAWYAAIENSDYNLARATLLKLSVPLPYGLGALNYSLKEIKSTLWNG